MSQRDLRIMKATELTCREVGAVFGISQQSVSDRTKNKRNFLNLERIIKLHKHLLKLRNPKAFLLESAVKKIWREAYTSLRVKSVHWTPSDAKELWVITSKPFEQKNVRFMDYMIKHYFSKTGTRVVYFLPTGPTTVHFMQYLMNTFYALPKDGGRGTAIIIETNMAVVVPHAAIKNPLDKNKRPEGFIRTDRQELTSIPNSETTKIIRTVLASGLGTCAGSFLPHNLSRKLRLGDGNGFCFSLVFDSSNEIGHLKAVV